MSLMVDETIRTRFEQGPLSRLRGLRRRLRWYLLLDGAAAVSVALLAAMAITLAADRALRLEWDMRVVQLAASLLVLAAIAWRTVLAPLRARITIEHLAALVERRYPHLQSRLISAVEFVDPEAAKLYRSVIRSPAMIDAVVGQAREETTHLRFGDILNHGRARRRAGVTIACAAMVVLAAAAQRETMALWFRRNVLLREVDWPQRNRLIVEGLTGGRMLVPRGEDVTVSARVDQGFQAPRQAYLEYQGERGLAGRRQMPAVKEDVVRFTHTFERLDETLRCRVTGGDAQTPGFTIEVVERPRIDQARLSITPPAYTKTDPYDLRPGQTVAEALAGSEIRFQVKTNVPVVRAALVRQVHDEEEQEVGRVEPAGGSDQEFIAADVPRESGTYHFRLARLVGGMELTNASERVRPVRFSVRLVADRPPKVKMSIKGAGEMITPEAILPIETDFADVYGLASAQIVHESSRAGAEPVAEAMPDFDPGGKNYTHKLDWPVGAHGLTDGDRLSLHAEASDFDNVSGPNVGKSAAMVFRVVTREELLAELNRRQQEYRQSFERLLRQQEQLYSDLLSLSTARDPQEAPEERSRRFDRLARQQRDQGGRLSALRLQLEQVLAEMRINQLSSPAVEARLGGGVIEPAGVLSRTALPAAAEKLAQLAGEETTENLQAARDAQEAVLADMNRILANMLKWENFQEAVILLREVIKMQRDVGRETETRIETEILGTRPASEPSNR